MYSKYCYSKCWKGPPQTRDRGHVRHLQRFIYQTFPLPAQRSNTVLAHMHRNFRSSYIFWHTAGVSQWKYGKVRYLTKHAQWPYIFGDRILDYRFKCDNTQRITNNSNPKGMLALQTVKAVLDAQPTDDGTLKFFGIWRRVDW